MTWLLWMSAAFADCDQGTASAVEALSEAPDEALYDCLSKTVDANEALIKALRGSPQNVQLSRGLAVWRLRRLEGTITGSEARAYLPAEIRLVSDGIKAHRGRSTPAAEHQAVFEAVGWYKPDPSYTDNRLKEIDRKNLAVLMDPPDPPPPRAEPLAPELEEAAEPEVKTCGCGAVAPVAGLRILLLPWLIRRR